MVEKKRGPRQAGGGGKDRPRIPSSHAGRAEGDLDQGPHGGDPGAQRGRRRPGRVPNGIGRPTLPASLAPSRAGAGGPRLRKVRPAPHHHGGEPGHGASAAAAAAAAAPSIASDEARALAVLIATAALEKKAMRVEVLDVAGKVDYADFLVLMTGRSDRQVQAIAQGIEEALRRRGRRPQAVEGLPHASWVLLDFIDVVVHVFQDEARSAYDLDGLWMDAERIPLPLPQEEP